MRSLLMEGSARIRIVEVADPTPQPGEVVIETAVSAICGSEMHGYRGQGQDTGNSGHEAVGTIESLGEGVEGLQVGQRVGVSAVVGCGHCDYCAKGQYTWCPNFTGYGSMHAERFRMAARGCHLLAEDVPWDAGVLLTGDGFGVPYHTSTKILSPEIKTVAVFGVGPIGLGSVLMQAYRGRRVIAVDVSNYRLEMAKRLGASETVSPDGGETVQQIRALTDGAGADICIEAAGRPETALACFAAVRTAGTVVFNGEQPALPISPSEQFIRRDITAVGSWFYHFCEFQPMLDLYRKGLQVTDLISHRYPFDQADAAFAEFAAGRTGKVLLEYGA